MVATAAVEARQTLSQVSRLAVVDVSRLWAATDLSDPTKVADALTDPLLAIGDEYGDMAGTVAADLYDSLREIEGASGTFYAEPASLPDADRYSALARWGVQSLFGANPDALAALALISGGMQRVVANAHRDTIMEASVRDSAARGWRRFGIGECDFCQMLIDRGGVYSEASADFESHDHCRCAAFPSWA